MRIFVDKIRILNRISIELHSLWSNVLCFSILFGLDNGLEQNRYQFTIQITNGPVLLFSSASLGQNRLTASVVTIPACLTLLEWMTYISVIKLGHHWLRLVFVVCWVLNYYLNQCWLIVNWTLRNKLQCFNQNKVIFIQRNALQSVVCKMVAILFRPQCVNDTYPLISATDLSSKPDILLLIVSWVLMDHNG